MIVEPYKDKGKLNLDTDHPDLRRDIHVLVDYVREREVKRGHRDNLIPKTDARRLAKLMSDPEADDEIVQDGRSQWVDFVDEIVLALEFVNYDIKGEYAGYTSAEPSFPDNYVELNVKAYDTYLKKSLADQEAELLEVMLAQGTGNRSEFFSRSVFSRLDRFSTSGSAIGVVPTLDFPKARRLLLKLLAEFPVGEWLSTASLIAYMKQRHPYFLIPAKPQVANKWDRNQGRYDNFREGERYEGPEVVVKASDSDGFERVEGRYIERFLEGVPKLLGYVDVGYAKGDNKTRPMLGQLPAFRVSERLRRALTGNIAKPTVRVTPTFEVYVQSEVYAARVLSQLAPIGELVSSDATTIYRLTKQRVAAARAADHDLEVIRLLESLATTPLPENVRRELTHWSEHGEKFVLYSGFSLLETDPDVAVPERHQVECIEPGTYIVRSAKKLFGELEQQERMPLSFTHPETAFLTLPDDVRSSLRGKKRKKADSPPAKPQVTLMRVTRVQLLCPDREFLQRLQNALAIAGCPVEADGKNLSLVYSDRYEGDVGKAIKGLGSDYRVKIENKG